MIVGKNHEGVLSIMVAVYRADGALCGESLPGGGSGWVEWAVEEKEKIREQTSAKWF